MRYTLKDLGYPWRTIMKGRAQVGRVAFVEGKGWFGTIKNVTVGPYPEASKAFYEIAARDMGHADAAALHARNRAIAAHNKRGRAQARDVLNRIMSGDFRPLDELFKREDK
jgi:hypothetical protein